MPREIELYRTLQGKMPFKEWFESLKDVEARAQIHKRLARIRLGLLGDHKSLGEDLYELRINLGPGYRIYFSQIGKTIILLLAAIKAHSLQT